MTHSPLLTTTEVARALEVSRRTVHRMVAAQQLQPDLKVPGYRGAYLFKPADVDALKASRTAGSVVSGEPTTA